MILYLKSNQINYISLNNEQPIIYSKTRFKYNNNFSYRITTNDELYINGFHIDIWEIFDYTKEMKRKLDKINPNKQYLNIEIEFNEKEVSNILFNTNNKPFKINMNFRDCININQYKFILAHEMGHVFFNPSSNERVNTLIPISIIFQLLIQNIIPTTIITLLITVILFNIKYEFIIGQFGAVILLFYLAMIIKLSFLQLKIYWNNFQQICKNYNTEFYSDLFSKRIGQNNFVLPKKYGKNSSITHPSHLSRNFNLLFNFPFIFKLIKPEINFKNLIYFHKAFRFVSNNLIKSIK